MKPWPEQGLAISTFACPGCRSIQEVLVQRIGVQAHDRGAVAAVGRRHEAPGRGTHLLHFRVRDFTAHILRGGRVAGMMEGELHPRAQVGKP